MNNPYVFIEKDVIKRILNNTVVAGVPAKVICTLEEYLGKEKERMSSSICYGEEYTLRQNVPMEKRMQQKEEFKDKTGYIN